MIWEPFAGKLWWKTSGQRKAGLTLIYSRKSHLVLVSQWLKLSLPKFQWETADVKAVWINDCKGAFTLLIEDGKRKCSLLVRQRNLGQKFVVTENKSIVLYANADNGDKRMIQMGCAWCLHSLDFSYLKTRHITGNKWVLDGYKQISILCGRDRVIPSCTKDVPRFIILSSTKKDTFKSKFLRREEKDQIGKKIKAVWNWLLSLIYFGLLPQYRAMQSSCPFSHLPFVLQYHSLLFTCQYCPLSAPHTTNNTIPLSWA